MKRILSLLLPILLLHATTPDTSVRLKRAIATLAGVTPALLLWLAYNALRFGNPFDTGYLRDATSAFGSSVWTGLYGLLCSPAASLFLYCPLALGGVAALALLWREDRRTAALLGGTAILIRRRVVDHLELTEQPAFKVRRNVTRADVIHEEHLQPVIPETDDHSMPQRMS